VNLFPQQFSTAARVSTTMNLALIPVYHADGGLYSHVDEHRLERLQSLGLIDRIVHSRKGQIMRAILFIRPGEAKPKSASSMAGTKYSHKERLKHGQAWDLKHLDGSRSGKDYAPPKTRAPFLQVVADRAVTRIASDATSAGGTPPAAANTMR
jgi:hypothetical protein